MGSTPSAIGFGRMIFFGSGGTIDTGRPMMGLEITSDTGLPGMFGFSGGSYTVAAQRQLKYVVGPHTTIPEPHVYNDIMHTVECIVENTRPIPTGEHARHVVELIEKAYISAEIGQHQDLTTIF
jgi:predicted dehydrogenase